MNVDVAAPRVLSNREGSRDVYRVPISDTGEAEGEAVLRLKIQ